MKVRTNNLGYSLVTYEGKGDNNASFVKDPMTSEHTDFGGNETIAQDVDRIDAARARNGSVAGMQMLGFMSLELLYIFVYCKSVVPGQRAPTGTNIAEHMVSYYFTIG